jgi:uncharacterized RDD family membrane protein YckC
LSDGVLFALPTLVVGWVVGGDHLYTLVPKLVLHRSVPGADLGFHLAAIAVVLLVAVGLWVAYRVGMTAWRGATIGKWAWGTRVVRVEDVTRPPTLGRAFTRWVVPQTAGLLPLPGTGLLPCLWLLRDRYRQGAHDKAARTLVIRRRSRPWERSFASKYGSAHDER